MSLDQDRAHDFGRTYTEAWCSHDPAGVADHYTPGGTIAINGGDPTEIAEVGRWVLSAFPDIQAVMVDLLFKEDAGELHCTLTATNQPRDGAAHRGRPTRLAPS